MKVALVMNGFKCKHAEGGYCGLWLRECVSQSNCQQGNCAHCVNGAIPPDVPSICDSCQLYDWKCSNYE